MSLLIDTRAGSEELVVPLQALGLPAERAQLPAGDVEIWGRGPAGRPLMVGVEFKLLRDMLTCVRDGRFAEQLRGMAGRYEVRWLLLEGEWRTSMAGTLEVREERGFMERGRFTMQEAVAWSLTMAQRGGVLLWRTVDRAESIAWLRALYWWWTSKDFEEHRAHLDWYRAPVTAEAPWDEPTLVQRVAAVLPGLGAERALAASKAFGSVRALVNADAKQLQQVDGIGPKTARKVVEAVS